MITDQLYTTQFSDTNAKCTATIPNIPIETETFTQAYWLGWISNDNLPDAFKVGTFELVSGDEPAVKFTDITDYSKNRDFTYFTTVDGSGGYLTTFSAAPTFYDTVSTPPVWVAGGTNARLVNDMLYQSTGYGYISLTFFFPAVGALTGGTQTVQINIKNFIDFLQTQTYEITLTIGGDSFRINGQDFDENGVIWVEQNGTTRPVFIAQYEFIPMNSVLPGSRYIALYPAVHTGYTYNDSDFDSVSCTRRSLGYADFLRIRGDTLAVSYVRNDNIYPVYADNTPKNLFGLNTVIKISDLATVTTEPYIQDGVCVSYSYGSGGSPFFYNFYKIFRPADIYRHASLLRWCIGTNATGYVEYGIYYPLVDLITNEFKCALITGAESHVKPRIPAWMKYDLSESTYTEDDKPLPEPPDIDSDGDDITPYDFVNTPLAAANNFITLYAMNADFLTNFGEKMWAALGDPNFWAMVGTVFLNDCSINPADMMKYIIFLRYYPIDLSAFGTLANGIYFGRATVPIVPDVGVSYPYRINRNIVQLTGGTLTIPRYYGDFRDYEPCTDITLYIPYCGAVKLCPAEVTGKTLELTYYLDLQTGALKAIVRLYSDTTYIVASVAGTCGASIQVSANNNIEFLQRIATVSMGAASGVSSGLNAGGEIGEVAAGFGGVLGAVGSAASVGLGAGIGAAIGGVGALAGLPPVAVHASGNTTGFANLAGSLKAYVTIQYQKYVVPKNYGHTTGYAVQFDDDIKNLSGYVLCENVDTTGLTCSEDERTAIKQLLERGIYV